MAGNRRNMSALSTKVTTTANGPVTPVETGTIGTVKEIDVANAKRGIVTEMDLEAKGVLKTSAALVIGALILLWILGGVVIRDANL